MMIGGCALDSSIIHCMLRYHPWYLVLFGLAIIGVGTVVHMWRTP